MPRTVDDTPSTPHFDFLYGSFVMSKWHIPYLSTTMTLQSAGDVLQLATDLPGAEEITWKLDELYQRDIDWPRVERQIVPYLNNREVPQFFNAITIALLPYDGKNASLAPSFGAVDHWTPPNLIDPSRFAKQTTIGPISLGYWESWETEHDPQFRSGQVRWNPSEVFAVAIDGQHRLAAIKALSSSGSPGPAFDETRVPVILLVFDERLGYLAADEKPTVEVLRALFIDLNKHAQTVSRARQILLDDRDPHAVSVRRLVGEQLSEDFSDLSSSPPRLPLSLIDWYSEQAKFDDGPCLSTVLGLDWIISRVLETLPIRDFTNYAALKRQIRKLELQLGIDLEDALGRVEELESVKLSAFAYKDSELDDIANAFQNVWSAPLVHLLTGFSPYSSLIARRIGDGSDSLDFQTWYRLYRKEQSDPYNGRATDEYRHFLGRLASREEHPIGVPHLLTQLANIEQIKVGNLAFNVVFQRALAEAFLEYCKIGAEAVDELVASEEEDVLIPTFSDEEDVELFVDADEEDEGSAYEEENVLKDRVSARSLEFVDSMNRLLLEYPEFLNIEADFTYETESGPLWLGSLRKAEGGIDFTQRASTQAKDLLFMIAAMFLYDRQTDPEEGSDFDAFWDEVVSGEGPSLCRRIGRAVNRFVKDENSSAAGRIIKSRGEVYDYDVALEECYFRLRYLWTTAKL